MQHCSHTTFKSFILLQIWPFIPFIHHIIFNSKTTTHQYKMKNKASVFLKQVMSLVKAIAKAKSSGIKSKASEVKTRLVMYSLLKTKKLLPGSVTSKIHGILGHHEKDDQDEHADVADHNKALVVYSPTAPESHYYNSNADYEDDQDDKYPDLTHSLFDEEDFNDPGGSIIDLVKNSKEDGADFKLEDEIDHVADLFIMRFHRQMRLQKWESFKRLQEMIQRSA